jgi:hypothetical protein
MVKSMAKKEEHSPEVADRTRPSLKLREDESGVLEVEIEGYFERMSNPITGKAVAVGLIGHIASLGSQGKRVDEGASNFALGFVDAMAPKDAAEALLFTQMAAIHQVSMAMARRLNLVETIPQKDSAERALNKLTRTFAAQMDTLKRYRSKAQQTVRVERVNVHEGGQAVVGNVSHGGGANKKRR